MHKLCCAALSVTRSSTLERGGVGRSMPIAIIRRIDRSPQILGEYNRVLNLV